MKIWGKNFLFEERAFYRLNQRIILSRSEDVIFFSSNGDTTIDDKHLKINSQWRLRKVTEKKKTFSLQKYLNISISDKCSKEPLNLQSEHYVEFIKVTPIDGKWQNILQRRMPLCMKQVLKKWTCDQMRKLFIINRRNKN